MTLPVEISCGLVVSVSAYGSRDMFPSMFEPRCGYSGRTLQLVASMVVHGGVTGPDNFSCVVVKTLSSCHTACRGVGSPAGGLGLERGG